MKEDDKKKRGTHTRRGSCASSPISYRLIVRRPEQEEEEEEEEESLCIISPSCTERVPRLWSVFGGGLLKIERAGTTIIIDLCVSPFPVSYSFVYISVCVCVCALFKSNEGKTSHRDRYPDSICIDEPYTLPEMDWTQPGL